mmetsp:Transcript_103462/g.183492  ORF Transcript_103462/g.183492 Transcript_103462/m.183492 type:complete len:556 (+) Transcript_103462:133-1800(+)
MMCIALKSLAPLAALVAIGLTSYAAYGDEVHSVGNVPASVPDAGEPYILPLRRESVPVKRKGKVVSFKTSYSGVIHVGYPRAQEFRVVFDTGSGHVVLPAIECQSPSCLKHRRYNMRASKVAEAINLDGERVLAGELCDQVTVGFGTGRITGEFVRERVCLGPPQPREEDEEARAKWVAGPCNLMHVIVAVEMSNQPFLSFAFDGIIGMGLGSLALSHNFSFFQLARMNNQTDTSHFSVYLTEGEDGEQSELAIGGYSPSRLLAPLHWAPIINPDLGYWQVAITAIRVDGQPLQACQKGCNGIVDTGTSHLGIPAAYEPKVSSMLSRPAGDITDCRFIQAPTMEFDIGGFTLTLLPENYMRRLPLSEGVTVSSPKGISLELRPNDTAVPAETSAATSSVHDDQNATANASRKASSEPPRHCKAKVMAVNLPEPLGSNMWIFGEPLLHRYYTVFDSKAPQIGFGLAANRMNKKSWTEAQTSEEAGGIAPQKDPQILLIQTQATVEPAPAPSDLRGASRVPAPPVPPAPRLPGLADHDQHDVAALMQVSITLAVRPA